MMARRAILHIGTAKTGTSTLQAFLAKNRAALAARGVLYPRFAGAVNHTGLCVYAARDAMRDDLRRQSGVASPDDLARFRQKLELDAAAELSSQDARVVLLSNEHLSHRLESESEIRRLRDFLARHFDDVRVTLYLRRQDRLAVSLHATHLRMGATGTEILPAEAREGLLFDYARALDLWQSVFGADAITPVIYERESLEGGSVTSDFTARWALGDGFAPVEDVNTQLGAGALEFLRRMNTALPPRQGGVPDPVRQGIAAVLSRRFPGSGLRPARSEAETFAAQFAAGNERIRARWFPERATLFSADFSDYPETADPRDLGADEAVEMTAALWRAAKEREKALAHDLALREGEIAELTGDHAAAMHHYRRAADIAPGRGPARERLAALEGDASADASRHPGNRAAPGRWRSLATLRRVLRLTGRRR